MKLEALSLAALLAASFTLVTAAALQGWSLYGWSPCRGALSDLGVYPATRPLFNSGVALGALALAYYAARRLAWLIPAVSLALVAGFTEDYGAPHYAAAVAFFTSPLVLLPGEDRRTMLAYTAVYTALAAAAVTGTCIAVAEYTAAAILSLHILLRVAEGEPRAASRQRLSGLRR